MIHLRLAVAWILKLTLWGVIASIAWVTFSCEEFCEESNHTAVAVSFYSSTTGASLTVKKVSIKGIGNDEILYPPPKDENGNTQTDFSQVLLPVDPTADTVSFTIKNDTLAIDTIKIIYTRRDGFISSECGCVTYAEIQGEPVSTKHTIKNMTLISPNVGTVSYRKGVINAENIRIYY